MIHLLIADDHQILLDGFIAMFDKIDNVKVVDTAHNGQEVLDILEKNDVIDIVLLDINMPILNGVETCKRITNKFPSVYIIALTMHDQQSYFKRMMQHGAKGYLLKNDSVEEIEKAIKEVIAGGTYVSSQLKDELTNYNHNSSTKRAKLNSEVSPREREVLLLVSEGYTDQQIAEKLFISFHTVNSHRKNLIIKFDARNTAELIKKTMEKGVI